MVSTYAALVAFTYFVNSLVSRLPPYGISLWTSLAVNSNRFLFVFYY